MAVVIIWLFFRNSQLTKDHTVNIQALFDSADNYYSDVQKYLEKNIDSYGHEKSSGVFMDLIVYYHTYKEVLALCRKHVVTIISSDNNSVEAKLAVVNRWLEFMLAEKLVNGAIEAGVDQEVNMQNCKNAQDIFTGVMQAHNYDLQKEYKEIENRYKKYFGEKNKIKKNKIIK